MSEANHPTPDPRYISVEEKNTGHGHVFPRPDGVRARCGGPGLCAECSRDLSRKINGEPRQPESHLASNVVSRLRGERVCNTLGHKMLMHEAADEIDRLRAAVDEGAMGCCQRVKEDMTAEIERLKRERDEAELRFQNEVALTERLNNQLAALSGDPEQSDETSERQEISRLRHAIRKIRAHTAYRPGATPEFLAELLSSIARIASAAWHDFDDVKPDAEVALNAEHPWRAEIERLRALCAESQALMSEDFPERAEDLDRACASPRYLAHYKALLRELSDSPLKAKEVQS